MISGTAQVQPQVQGKYRVAQLWGPKKWGYQSHSTQNFAPYVLYRPKPSISTIKNKQSETSFHPVLAGFAILLPTLPR